MTHLWSIAQDTCTRTNKIKKEKLVLNQLICDLFLSISTITEEEVKTEKKELSFPFISHCDPFTQVNSDPSSPSPLCIVRYLDRAVYNSFKKERGKPQKRAFFFFTHTHTIQTPKQFAAPKERRVVESAR